MVKNMSASGAKSGNGPKCSSPSNNSAAKAGAARVTPRMPGPNPSSQSARQLKSGSKG